MRQYIPIVLRHSVCGNFCSNPSKLTQHPISISHTLLLALSGLQSLWDTMDSSPPGSSVRGIFQARILEWVAISFPGASARPRNKTRKGTGGLLHHRRIPALQADSLPTEEGVGLNASFSS